MPFTGVTTARFNVLPVTTQLVAPSSAAAGVELIVGLGGPEYQRDYIVIGKIDATDADQWEKYSYSVTGNPVTLAAPDDTGDYFTTYFSE